VADVYVQGHPARIGPLWGSCGLGAPVNNVNTELLLKCQPLLTAGWGRMTRREKRKQRERNAVQPVQSTYFPERPHLAEGSSRHTPPHSTLHLSFLCGSCLFVSSGHQKKKKNHQQIFAQLIEEKGRQVASRRSSCK
jgi:hypothetical protein